MARFTNASHSHPSTVDDIEEESSLMDVIHKDESPLVAANRDPLSGQAIVDSQPNRPLTKEEKSQ